MSDVKRKAKERRDVRKLFRNNPLLFNPITKLSMNVKPRHFMFDNCNDGFDHDAHGWMKMNPDVSPPINKCNIVSPEIKIERVSAEELESEEGLF